MSSLLQTLTLKEESEPTLAKTNPSSSPQEERQQPRVPLRWWLNKTKQIKRQVIHPACELGSRFQNNPQLAVDAERGYATVQTGHDRPIGSRLSSTSLLIGRRICLQSLSDWALPFCHTTVVVGGKCKI